MHCHTVHLPLGTLLTVCAVCGTVARCLLKDPPIVVLDEATSALDSVTEVAVHEALSQLGTGRTQLVVAHRLSTVVRASQIIVMSKGHAVERGTHAELAARPGSHYATFMRHQLFAPPAAAPPS